VNKTFVTSKTCGECLVWFETDDPAMGECRLNPPVPISHYASAYPRTRRLNPGCGCGVTRPKAKVKK
jgi:hypothetical protein